MSSNGNEFTYMNVFHGNLRAESEPVPVQVRTRLRIMTEETAREVKEFRSQSCGAPTYVFGERKDLPLNSAVQATGRHCFTW
jgi:hypothetical protein